MNQIADNQYYKIKTDPVKNRMYVQIIGYWKTPDLVPHFVDDNRKAKESLKPGFTLLADLREMKTPPLVLNTVHQDAQKTLINGGLDKTAEVLTDIVLQTVTKRIAQESHMKKQVFSNVVAAERWLSSQ